MLLMLKSISSSSDKRTVEKKNITAQFSRLFPGRKCNFAAWYAIFTYEKLHWIYELFSSSGLNADKVIFNIN